MPLKTKTLMLAVAGCITTAAFAAPPAPEFVMKAGASDMYERESSKLVLATSKDTRVRGFAQMMVKDHTKSTAEVTRAARRDGVKPGKPMLEPMQQSNIVALKAARGADRDRLYIDQQKMAHQQALALHSDYAATGDTPALKMAAGMIAPVVQHHIEMLAGM